MPFSRHLKYTWCSSSKRSAEVCSLDLAVWRLVKTKEIDGDICVKSLLEVSLGEKEHLEIAKIGKYYD